MNKQNEVATLPAGDTEVERIEKLIDSHLGTSPLDPSRQGVGQSVWNDRVRRSQLIHQIAVPDAEWKRPILVIVDHIWGQYSPSGTQPMTTSDVYACRALTLRLALSSDMSALEIREFIREQFNSRILETLAMYAIIMETVYNETSIPSEVSRINVEIYIMENLMLRQHLAILKPE